MPSLPHRAIAESVSTHRAINTQIKAQQRTRNPRPPLFHHGIPFHIFTCSSTPCRILPYRMDANAIEATKDTYMQLSPLAYKKRGNKRYTYIDIGAIWNLLSDFQNSDKKKLDPRGKTNSDIIFKKKIFSGRTRKSSKLCPTHTQQYYSFRKTGLTLDLCFGMKQTRRFFSTRR